MTILTAGACKFVVSSAGTLIPAAVGSAAGAILTGVKIWMKAEAVGQAIGAAVGTGTSAGAITGAIVTKTAASALSGALVGGMSAAGLGTVLAGSFGALSGGVMADSLGLLCVGTSAGAEQVTYDCWKPVIRDRSEGLSDGMLLKDLCSHPNVAEVTLTPREGICLPHVVLKNIWNEKYELEYVLNTDRLSCHASLIDT